jgi:tRNA uridine 5-carboxymethylaminomethyl modification enzyme
MSCNPAIGGLAKGQLVREIDALGGEMGLCTDFTGLQFRMLNTRKGPAVWAPRAQCDKKAYQFRMKWTCERQSNLHCKQGQTAKLVARNGKVVGVETTLGTQFHGETVVVTTGTFLRGLLHVGMNQQQGGRSGDPAAMGLSDSLSELGIKLGRLKTGTPPRLLRSTINFTKTEAQFGDEPISFFTFWKNELFHVEQPNPEHPAIEAQAPGTPYPVNSILSCVGGQLPCYITYTTDRTAQLIRANLDKSPMYSGIIRGTGPRYCPSIEDKIVKFPEKERQQIFLEPEGITTEEFYVNGFSTCLPFEIQIELVRSIIGCENAEIMRPAYAVEYDFADPTQLHPSLESKLCENLFLAGQINGTSGYEEAAAQGLLAGINAARKVQGKHPIVLRRDQAYIGVLIDDLVTKGTVEPYRMFTSRAEYRLVLRQDNADLRLSEIGHEIGLLNHSRFATFTAKRDAIIAELARLDSTYYGSEKLSQILRRPELSYADLPDKDQTLSPDVVRQVEIAVKYAGYVDRQQNEIDRLNNLEGKIIPETFDFERIQGLRFEARQKLTAIRPTSIGQAARVSGISPADINLLLIHLRRHGREVSSSHIQTTEPKSHVDTVDEP